MAVKRLVNVGPRHDGTPFVPTPGARYETIPEQTLRNWGFTGDVTNERIEVAYEGAVVGTYEKNGYDDSDFYAVVETAPGEFTTICYASTRGWTYANSAAVDATPEVLERAYRHVEDAEKRNRELLEKYEAEREAEFGRKGKTVKVTGGRKNKGKSGVITWVGESYGESRYRVQPEDGEGFFVPARQTDLPDNEPARRARSRYDDGMSLGAAMAYSLQGFPRRPREVVPS